MVNSSVDSEVVTVLYSYVIPTQNLSGKQTVTYSGATKEADVIAMFNISDDGIMDYSGYDWNGLKFELTGLADGKTKEFTVLEFVYFAKSQGYLFLDYNEPMTITLKNESDRPMNANSNILDISDVNLVGLNQSDDAENQTFYSWTVKSDRRFNIMIVLRFMQVFPQRAI